MPPNEPQQPQNSSAQGSPPSPSPEYNFIFNGDQKPKKRLNVSLPFASKLPRPVIFALMGAVALIIIIPIVSAIFSKPANSDQLIRAAAKAQEIIRVSGLVQQQTRDGNTQSLAITALSSLTSDQVQIKSYLASGKIKIGPKNLMIYLDKNTDKSLEVAAQTNSLEKVYAQYLKKQLTDYNTYLKSIYPNSSPKAKIILKDAYSSSGVLLSSPSLSSIV